MKYSNDKKDFIEKVRNLFLTYFANLGIEMEFFDIIKHPQKGIDYFVYKFIDIFSIEDVSMFLPITADENKNNALLFLPQIFNVYLKFHKYFEWSIKVPLQIYILDIDKKARDLLLIENFVDNYERINIILKTIYILFNNPFLYIKTYRHKDYVFKEIGEKVYEEAKKDLKKDEKYFLFILPYLGFKERNLTFDSFSPLYILNFTFQVLNNEVSKIISDIKNFISKRISYENIVNVSISSEYEAEWDSEIEDNNDNDLVINDVYVSWIEEWLKLFKKINYEKLHLLQFNNLFFKYVDRNYKKIKPNLYCHLGDFIETEIFIFFNEMIANFINNSNMIISEIKSPTSVKKFFKNLEKIKETNKDIYLLILAFCLSPFIYPYISSENRKKIKDFPKEVELFKDLLNKIDEIDEIDENGEKYNVYNLYSALKIMDGKCSKIPEEICKKELFSLFKENKTIPTIEDLKEQLKKKKRTLPTNNKLQKYIDELKTELSNYLKECNVEHITDPIYKQLFEKNSSDLRSICEDEKKDKTESSEAKK
jgi:hypothetical protein